MMHFRTFATILLLLAPTSAFAQSPPVSQMSDAEQENLRHALEEAGNSQVDFVRALEDHLVKFPKTVRRAELERALAKSAIDLHDNPRIIRYGEEVLKNQPDDLQLLEHVAIALMQTGGLENLKQALAHAEHFEQVVKGTIDTEKESQKDLSARDQTRHKDEHDHAQARACLLLARAHGLLGHTDTAVTLAEKSYDIFASVEAGREAAKWLEQAGRTEEAIQFLANAFTISGMQSANPEAESDREKMGELYRKLNGSEKGLGDVILKAYDRTFSQLAARREMLRQADPNAQVKDPMEFTLADVSGGKLQLASLKGKVIVMDFWATWCGPCRVQHPLYEEVKKKFKDRQDVVFLAINTDEDRSQVKPFLEQTKWNQAVYFEDGLSQLLKVSSIPTTVVFNKQGEVYSRMMGFIPERFVDMLADRIHEALGDKPEAHEKPMVPSISQ